MSGAGSGTIPKGVGAPPPPGMDPRRGKLMCIKVRMLDDTIGVFHLGHKAHGQALFDEVCRHLNLLECDYFGLEFTDCFGNRCWLDKDKPILRQITNTQSDARFYFIVKFYTPNPSDLEEEYTRYLFAQQIKRDLASGELLCNENTAALLSSYIVQSDCGDFSSEDYPDHSYLSSARFIPNQSIDFQKKVMENHAKLVGMSPGESDMTLLETARRCDFYGIRMHSAKLATILIDTLGKTRFGFAQPHQLPGGVFCLGQELLLVKDVEGTDVTLAVAHMGIKVFHLLQCVSTFSWAKIRKLSFKRRKLLIKLHPESYQYYKETIEFSFDSRNECKNFWKKSVEHHAFFRCSEVTPTKKSRESRFFSKGSSFRYHGRTQKQLIDYVREHRKRREPFTRPLKPGLSLRNERFSRPMPFDVNSSYSTVGDRVFGNGSRDQRSVNSMPSRSDGVISGANGTRMVESGNQRMDLRSRLVNASYSQPGSSRTQHNRSSLIYGSGSGAVSDSERMCVSDMESGGRMDSSSSSTSRFGPPSKPLAVQRVIENENESDALKSLSLPNVHGDDLHVVCKEFELKCECPPKSASGDNFLDMHQNVSTRDYDNTSEGSYRLSDYEQYSTYSDASHTNPIYSTKFTTKRVGDVIIKKVITSTKSTSNTDDEESGKERKDKIRFKQSDLKTNRISEENENAYPDVNYPSSYIVKSHGNYAKKKCSMERIPLGNSPAPSTLFDYPLHRKIVPIEIDGPNVKLDEYRARLRKVEGPYENSAPFEGKIVVPNQQPCASTKSSVIYTSSGAILHKPKVITDLDIHRDGENISSQISLAQKPATVHNSATFMQPVMLPKTYGASGPLPGKVISKENLMITPEGIRERQVKPAVPPKPKNLMNLIEDREIEKGMSSHPVTPPHPVVNLQAEALVGPPRQKLDDTVQRPTLISIQSEDHPEIQRCHLFNSDIPYVLTMRNISTDQSSASGSTFSTFKGPAVMPEPPEEVQLGSLMRNRKPVRSPDSSRRRKSLDLVPRKRLPSPSNFSSQDHSISPTTPDSGDVLEYLLRKRSQDKSSLAKKGKRGDLRRQTQPVRFNLPVAPDMDSQKIASMSQPNLNDENLDDDEDEESQLGGHGHAPLNRSMSNIENSSSCAQDIENAVASQPAKGVRVDFAIREMKADDESSIGDDFPPPPPPPPLPPACLYISSGDDQSAKYGNLGSSQENEVLPFVDESASSRASYASKEDLNEIKERTISTSTLRTPTGVLWTDF